MDQHHDHEHGLGIEHEHEHQHENGTWLERLGHFLTPHSHEYQTAALDPALATERGIRVVKLSLLALLLTAGFQILIFTLSGSSALLADTIHNFSDALTAIPLGLAFTLSRRARNMRYTYGYGRAEDIAGMLIVLMILFSSLESIYQSAFKIINPRPVTNLEWVAAAALVGFLGNEYVAILRTRTGREIGSAALIADGTHARTDGFTSLAVLFGAVGVRLGYPLLDPLIGLAISVAILFICWDSAREMSYRVMDAVDPQITDLVGKVAGATPGVMDVHDVTVRWVGHRQRAEFHITVDCQMSTCESHTIAEKIRHQLFHNMPALVDATVHVDPCECGRCGDPHPTAHHTTSSLIEHA